MKEEKKFMGLERINGFSDAVFAVATTPLTLTIDTPAVWDISKQGCGRRGPSSWAL